MMASKDGGWILPTTIDPPRVSVCVPVPDDPEHRRAFVGALYQLTYWWNWQRDEEKTARLVARVWLDIFMQVVALLDLEEYCGDEGGDDMTAIEDMLRDIKTELRLSVYDGTPDSINPDAPVNLFDRDADNSPSGEELIDRAAALCFAARKYVYDSMYQFHARAAAAAGVVGVPAALAFLLGGPIGFVVGAFALAITAYLYDDVLDAASDQTTLDEIVCELYVALRGIANNATNFQAAVAGLDDGTGNRAIIVDALKTFRNKTENYIFLQDALAAGYTAAQAGAENDCCVPEADCAGWIDFQNDGLTFGGLYRGSYLAGEGVSPTTVISTVEYMAWQTEWETPCTIPTGSNFFRLKIKRPVSSANWGYFYHMKRADTGEWVAVGGVGAPSGPTVDGWMAPATYPLASDIEWVGIRVNEQQVASAWSATDNIMRGFWWGTDVAGTPPF
jgi:hypothetical protein